MLVSPPMLLPQAKSVRPNTVLLRLSTMPSMCRTLTTSDAAALISTALTRKPNTANTWNKRTSQTAHFIMAAIIDDCMTDMTAKQIKTSSSPLIMDTYSYGMIFWGTVIGGGAEDNSRQEESQEENKQPERKLALDLIISILIEKTREVKNSFCNVPRSVNIHRWGTHTLQTGRQVRTPEVQWSDGGSLVGVSSFYLLYQGRLQGCRAAAGPPRASDSNIIIQGIPQQTTSVTWDPTHLQYFEDSPAPRFPSPLPAVHWVQRGQQDLTGRLSGR